VREGVGTSLTRSVTPLTLGPSAWSSAGAACAQPAQYYTRQQPAGRPWDVHAPRAPICDRKAEQRAAAHHCRL